MKEVKEEKKTKTTRKKAVASEEKKDTKKKTTKAETKKEEKVTKKSTTKEKSEVKKGFLNKIDQKRYRTLCKIVRILAKIGKIILMIFVPFIFLAMIFVPVVFSKFEIDGNIIRFEGASIVVRDDTLSVKIGDNIQVFDSDTDGFEEIIAFVNDNPKGTIVAWFEISLLLLGVVIVFEIFILCNVEKLFGNMEREDTPFTNENANIILLIGIYLIASKVAIIAMAMFALFNDSISTINILEILVVFITYYVFKYGAGVQKESNLKICD